MDATITRRDALLGMALARRSRPNVLLIAADDLNVRLGCYGFPVKTPHLDALAGRGVRFERAYCQYPLCNPSRTSLLTGKRPPATGITGNTRWFRLNMPEVVTLPQYFRLNGYVTAAAGKIFHGGLDDDRAWEIGGTPVAKGGVRTSPGTPRERQAASDRWQALPDEGEKQTLDYRNASKAIELMEQFKGRQPFFLALGFAKPHTPFLAPKKYFDLYDAARIPLPPNFAAKPEGTSPSVRPNWDLFSVRDGTPELARQAIAAYYACISFMDAQVGRVMAALDGAGLARNTIVVFFGDNGWHLGEWGMWGKSTLFEPSCRVPLTISAPGMAAGRTCARMVEFTDLYPTLAELAGLPRGAGLEGASLAPLLRDPRAEWKRAAYTYLARGKGMAASVRDERYRYTEWPDGTVELFDYEKDPHELRNRSGNRETVRRMSALLRGHRS
ncbi:MAG: sulfatase [Bryobacteraceae bacterium]